MNQNLDRLYAEMPAKEQHKMNETILVVDDEPGALALMEIMLRRKGFNVLTASDAYRALALLAKEKPDLIILDVMMPGITGLELCRELRSRPDTAQIPVLMLSAWSDFEAVQRGLEAGANEYLKKTLPPSHIISRVQALLAHKQSRANIC